MSGLVAARAETELAPQFVSGTGMTLRKANTQAAAASGCILALISGVDVISWRPRNLSNTGWQSSTLLVMVLGQAT